MQTQTKPEKGKRQILKSSKGDEGGTPELRAKIKATGGFHIGHDAETNKAITINRVQVPLDYYAMRDWISERQFDAGQEFYRLWYFGAEKSGFVTVRDPREPAGGQRDFESRAMLEQKYNRAKKAIRGLVQALICYNVCCVGEWASHLGVNKIGKVIHNETKMHYLRGGLDDLGDHFKFAK